MRFPLAAFVLAFSASGALAGSDAKAMFDNMKPEDAARLNQAAASDPKARETLDQVERGLKDGGHKAGTMLEKTRP